MKYDVFISHASEDKADFVHSLVQALVEKGLSVWYDEFTLHLGDSLTESINKGLSNSSFGIVILSRDFFRKNWPKRELSALISREDDEEKVIILPVWHNITKDEVLASFPLIADKYAVMSKEGMPTVIHKIFEVVKPDMIAEEHYQKGLMLEKNKLPYEAMEAYFKAQQINPDHPYAFHRIGLISILNQNSHNISETTIKIGTLIKHTDKGFGFITGEDGKSYFASQKSLEESPTILEGDRVAFLVEKHPKGVSALAVIII